MSAQKSTATQIVAVIWITVVLFNYHPLLFSEEGPALLRSGVDYLKIWILNLTVLLSPAIRDFGLGLLLLVVAFAGGHTVLRRFRFFHNVSAFEELVFATGLGLFLLSQILFAASTAGLLYRAAVRALIYGAGLILVPVTARYVWTSWRQQFRTIDPLKRNQKVLLWLAVWVASFTLLGALRPEIDFDALVYHLTGPRLYLEANGFYDIPEILETVFPKNVEMLFVAGLALRDEQAVRTLVFLIGVLTAVGMLSLAQRYLNRDAGIIGILFFMLVPVVAMEMQAAYIDLPIAFFSLFGLYGLLLWIERREPGWLALAALALAFLTGAKYTGAFNVIASILTLSVILLWRPGTGSWRDVARVALTLCIAAALGFLPWSIFLFNYTGDPVFPYLSADPLFSFTAVFDAPRFETYNRDVVASGKHRWGLPLTPSNVVATLWRMHLDNELFNGILGPFFLALLPLAPILRPAVPLWLWVFSGSYFFLWLATIQSNRYLIPILPLASLAAAAVAVELVRSRSARHFKVAGGSLLVVALLLQFPFNFKLRQQGKFFYAPLVERYQFNSFLEYVSKEKYLAYHFWSLPAIDYLNRQPGEKTVLYIGYRDGPPLYYMKFRVIYNELAEYNRLLAIEDPDELWLALRQRGVTHVIVEDSSRIQTLVGSPESPFVRRYTRTILETNAATLFELLPDPVPNPPGVISLLDHAEEKTFVTSVHSGMVWGFGFVLPPLKAAICQVHLPPQATLRLQAGTNRYFSPDPAHAEVALRDEAGAEHVLYRREFRPLENWGDRAWIKEDLDLSRWSGQRVRIVFSNTAKTGKSQIGFPIPLITSGSRNGAVAPPSPRRERVHGVRKRTSVRVELFFPYPTG